MSLFFRNLTCQKALVLRNNRNIQIVYCQINPHKHSQRAADLILTAVLVFLLEKSVNLPLNFNTLSLLCVTSVTGAVSPAVDVNQLLSINEVGSCVLRAVYPPADIAVPVSVELNPQRDVTCLDLERN